MRFIFSFLLGMLLVVAISCTNTSNRIVETSPKLESSNKSSGSNNPSGESISQIQKESIEQSSATVGAGLDRDSEQQAINRTKVIAHHVSPASSELDFLAFNQKERQLLVYGKMNGSLDENQIQKGARFKFSSKRDFSSAYVMDSKNDLDVSLLTKEGDVAFKGIVSGLLTDYHDEGVDELVPLENGTGFLQIENSLGGDLHFAVHKYEGNSLIKILEVDSSRTVTGLPVNYNGGILSNPIGTEFIVNSFKHYPNDKIVSELTKYSISGSVIWTKAFQSKIEVLDQFDTDAVFANKLVVLTEDETKKLLIVNASSGSVESDHLVEDCCIEWSYLNNEVIATGEATLHLLSRGIKYDLRKEMNLSDKVQINLKGIEFLKDYFLISYTTNYKYPDKRYGMVLEQGIIKVSKNLGISVLTFDPLGVVSSTLTNDSDIFLEIVKEDADINFYKIKI